MSQKRFYGKFCGTVVNNKDPMGLGRIQVQVPDTTGIIPSLTWVKPSSPYAGLQTGTYVLPPFGAAAWIEFEQGDPDYPVCSGFHWGGLPQTPLLTQIVDKQVPPEVPFMMTQTMTQSGFFMGETPVGLPFSLAGPGVALFSTAGLYSFTLDTIGITLTCGATKIIVSPTGIVISTPSLTFLNTGPITFSLPPQIVGAPLNFTTGITAAAVTATAINGKPF